jgi:hypothetical protein
MLATMNWQFFYTHLHRRKAGGISAHDAFPFSTGDPRHLLSTGTEMRVTGLDRGPNISARAAVAICPLSSYTSRRMSDLSVELDLKFLARVAKRRPVDESVR